MSALGADGSGPASNLATPDPAVAPRKYLQGLPPTYLAHLRSLLHQFLSQQSAPPNEGLPGPSNQTQYLNRPLWTPERLAEIEQVIWGVVSKDGGGGKAGLLGCDWERWAAAARLRKEAWKSERSGMPPPTAVAEDVNSSEAEGTVRGLGLRLPVSGLLPSALSSATSTPTKGVRSPSITSSSYSRPVSGQGGQGDHPVGINPPLQHLSEAVDELEVWSRQIRGLKGFLPLTESVREGWEVLDDDVSLRMPIREIPGAFPQAYSSRPSSEYFRGSVASLSSPQQCTPTEPLQALLKPVICLTFSSTSPSYRSGSTKSQSTLRPARGNSGSEMGSAPQRHASLSSMSGGNVSSGLGGLGGWFGNKWSAMTACPEDKVEMEFASGKFALPTTSGEPVLSRSSTMRRKERKSPKGNGLNNNDNDGKDEGSSSGTDNDVTIASHGSMWSGTESGDGVQEAKDNSKHVILLGAELDIPEGLAAQGEVGIMGGTIIIQGVHREEERRGIEKVLTAIIYTLQSYTFELSLLDAFCIPREPDSITPPCLPFKPDIVRSRAAVDVPSPGLSEANTHAHSERKGFFAKLGLSSVGGGGKRSGRGVWDGLVGKRKASILRHSGDETAVQPEDPVGGLFRQSSTTRVRSISIAQPHITSAHHTALFPHSQAHHTGGIDRHLHLLAQIGGMLHSTTPGLAFPLPGILLRVYEEDRIRREKAGEEIKVENEGLRCVSGTAAPQLQQPDSTAGLRHRTGTIPAWGSGSTVSSAMSGSIASTGTGIDGLPLGQSLLPGPPRIDEVRGRALGYRLGGDIRSGLASLAGTLDGWEGWCRLQRLEYVFWTGVDKEGEGDDRIVLACTKPVASVHRYYDAGTDMTVEDYLKGLEDELGLSAGGQVAGRCPGHAVPGTGATEAILDKREEKGSPSNQDSADDQHRHTIDESGSWEPVCARSACGIAERDHLRIWAAGGRRVVGKVVKPTLDATVGTNGSMRARVECDTCGARNAWMALGLVQGMSWNKFLELILYSSLLVAPNLCSHAIAAARPTPSSTSQSNFNYILYTPLLSLHLTSKSQPVLDTRLPKLQVGPLVAKRKTGIEAAKAASDAFASAGDKRRNGVLSQEDKERLVKGWNNNVSSWVQNLAKSSGSAKSSLDPITADLLAITDRLNASPPQSESEYAKRHQEIARADLKSIQQRLESWRAEHKPDIPTTETVIPSLPGLAENQKGLRLPGSAVSIKDDEPASVIAYTLSSLAYFNELCGGNTKSAGATSPNADAGPTARPYEQWKIEVSRRDSPREILPLRALTKKRSEMSLLSTGRVPLNIKPNTPSLELNLQPVSGHSGAKDGASINDLVKSISNAAGQDSTLTINPVPAPSVLHARPNSTEPIPSSLAIPPSNSTLSLSESDLSAVEDKRHISPRFRRRMGDEAPPSSFRRTISTSASADTSPRSTPAPIFQPDTPPMSSRYQENTTSRPPPGAAATTSVVLHERQASVDREGWGGSVTSSFASSFNTLLKLGTDVTDSFASRVRAGDHSKSLASIMKPLNFTSAEPNPDDSRPHIHVDLSHPKYKISCTVYFASAFDTLRRRCAFDRSFVRSLERSVGWLAEGGKSKANFWKTEDGRLVVKSLVTKWNVSDLQALLDIAPAYFEHMASTHNKATALAKILGFYTVKIHDLQSGEKRTMDLLVMENLFWKQEIDQTFDLKGIEGRRVQKNKDNGSTLFDAEWLEGQATSPLLVHPHAKRILIDSLTTDTRFLSNQNIVDYSLLLGLDHAHSELVVGVVDAVGSYELFKNIESMGKIALNRGREGEVTIINIGSALRLLYGHISSHAPTNGVAVRNGPGLAMLARPSYL